MVHGHSDFSHVLKNGLAALISERRVVSSGPESLHLMLNHVRDKGYLLHGINVTAAPTRPVSEIVSLHNINLEVTLDAATLKDITVINSYGGQETRI